MGIKGAKKEKKPMTPLRAFLDKLVFSLYVIALIAACCFSCFIWFQKTYFESYWVNGQSMWPTLNSETRDSSGQLFGDTRDKKSMIGATGVDFVIADGHKNILDKIQRFDIVVCKYGDDDFFEKIKRIIIMPGETFYFDALGEDVEGNGTLHILNKKTNEYEVLNQPVEDKYIVRGDYSNYGDPEMPTTLADNEYFVMGDNRANSSDSRDKRIGPISKDNIEAKAIALVARCKTVLNSQGKLVPTDIKYFWPRYF